MVEQIFSQTTFESDNDGVVGILWTADSGEPHYAVLSSGESAAEDALWSKPTLDIQAVADKSALPKVLMALLNHPEELVSQREFGIAHYEFVSEFNGGIWHVEDAAQIRRIEECPDNILIGVVRVDEFSGSLPKTLSDALDVVSAVWDTELDPAIEENAIHVVLLKELDASFTERE